MLDRIDIAIFHVAAIVFIVSDQVFPEATLPDAALAARATNLAQLLDPRDGFRELDLDQSPARRKVGVTLGQGPDGVEMIRQHDESVDMKWMTLACAARRFAQRLDLVGQKRAAPIEQVGGEEPAASGDKRATIVGHTRRLTDSERGAIKRLRPTRNRGRRAQSLYCAGCLSKSTSASG